MIKNIVLAALLFFSANLLIAETYIVTKSEFKYLDSDYDKAVHQARLGYQAKSGTSLTYYAEVGRGLVIPESVAAEDSFAVMETGIKFPATDKFNIHGKWEGVSANDRLNHKIEIVTRYNF